MKKISIFAVALGLLMVVAAAQPAFAVCSNARLMSSGYIYTPGTVYEYAVSGDTVTDMFAGTFWALGEGDPALGVGADSGSFPALEWLYNFGDYGYAAFIGGAPWATDARVDGCIDATPSTCTAIQLTDVNPETGEPVFALLTAEQDTAKNYSFFDGRIDLAPLPPVSIANSTRVGETGVIVDVAAIDAAAFDAGLYLDPNCTGAAGGGVGIETVVPGVAWFAQVLPRGAQPPTNLNIATGGWMSTGVNSLFGEAAALNIPCTGDSDIYVSFAFLNESNIPADTVTGPGTRTECGANVAEPELRTKPANTQESKPRTRKR
jgi:hypothetical protein